MYRVQVGKGKGSYTTRYSVDTWYNAIFWYNGINVHSGYKKRIINQDGKVLARMIT